MVDGLDRRAVAAHDKLVGDGDAVERAVLGDWQHERVIEAAGALHDRAAAGAAAKNRNFPRFARGHVHFGCDLVRVANNDERLRRFPEAQALRAFAGFAPIEQRLVARQIFSGRGKCQVEMAHRDFAGVGGHVKVYCSRTFPC
jgi:hypothetical protein